MTRREMDGYSAFSKGYDHIYEVRKILKSKPEVCLAMFVDVQGLNPTNHVLSSDQFLSKTTTWEAYVCEVSLHRS